MKDIQGGGNQLLRWLVDTGLAIQNLSARKLRAFLTMLGIIFGVATVVSMMSIGAGAQQQVLAFIEQLGVRNLIIEARDVTDTEELRRTRQLSAGLSFKDLRIIRANVEGITLASAKKKYVPTSTLPKAGLSIPEVYGIDPEYMEIAGLGIASGRFFTHDDNLRRSPVCVLGDGAAESVL